MRCDSKLGFSRDLAREATLLGVYLNAETRFVNAFSFADYDAACQILFVCCTKYDPCIEKLPSQIIELVETVFDVLLELTIYFLGEHHDIRKFAPSFSIYGLCPMR